MPKSLFEEFPAPGLEEARGCQGNDYGDDEMT